MSARFSLHQAASLVLAAWLAAFCAIGCEAGGGKDVDLSQQAVAMTFIHTTDIHSKILPFRYEPTASDQSDLGIPVCNGGVDSEACENFTYGGAARAAMLIKQERAKTARSAYIDSGDFFQGAPIFNLFRGEAEIRALTEMGVDVAAIGNHEFDNGVQVLSNQLYQYAGFQVLNANYMWTNAKSGQLGNLVEPFAIRYYDGLRVGYIGMGNVVSMTSIAKADNSLGIRALDAEDVLNSYIPYLRNQVDLLVVVSHMGLATDLKVAQDVPGIDIIFGGHDHIVVRPPAEIKNADGRTTLVVHSGVNLKVFGRLDVVVQDHHVIAHTYKAIPVGGYDDPDKPVGDPMVANVLYNYEFELNRAQNIDRVIGTATAEFQRNADDGGDSALGNLVADAMRQRENINADFAMTNSLGIRADLPAGDIKVGKLYEIFPFENSITTMLISGGDLKKLFDYSATKTAEYGCASQIQLSGARVELDCERQRARFLQIGKTVIIQDYELVAPNVVYNMATNDYIAGGGSGFSMLEQNTTKFDTSLSLRDVVLDYIETKQTITPVKDGRIKLVE